MVSKTISLRGLRVRIPSWAHMTLPKKARNITIDDEKFRWLLMRSGKWPTFIAEKDGNKSSLIMNIPWVMEELDWEGNRVKNGAVAPEDIEICIRTAMAKGWDPNGKGRYKYEE